ncbi:hypothetical protein [Thermococcus sp.]|uniref:hypothetical protein n=1 Tax=Thermococcus sp. TaxID=35749 RepID=UPI00261551FB|nr:hypothetical protein [Thermococcus sp.]
MPFYSILSFTALFLVLIGAAAAFRGYLARRDSIITRGILGALVGAFLLEMSVILRAGLSLFSALILILLAIAFIALLKMS